MFVRSLMSRLDNGVVIAVSVLDSEAAVSSGAIVVAAKDATQEGGGLAGSGGGEGSIKGSCVTQTSFMTGISGTETTSVVSVLFSIVSSILLSTLDVS